jgi:hypothetical protein
MIITPEEAQKKLRVQADRAFRALVLEATRRIVLRTPVDTGRARGNWHISIGQPEFTANPPEETDKGGSTTIVEANGKIDNANSGDTVYLTNGLPYVPVLEDGSSKQAPGGMVKVTAAELRPLTEQVAAKIRAIQ